MRAARTPWFSSSRMALTVVPAGQVTASRSLTGCSPLSRSITAAPMAAWTIRSWAWARAGRAGCRRRSSPRRGSRSRRVRAGERGGGVLLGLGTRRVLPTAPKMASACPRCAEVAWRPAEMTDMPSSTRTGVFGMTRTTGCLRRGCSSMNPVVMPAAALMTRRSAARCGASSARSVPMSWGLTARMRVSALLGGLGVADRLDAVTGAELPGALGASGGDQEVGGGPAGPDHSAEEGFADLAGAEDCTVWGMWFTLRVRRLAGHASAGWAILAPRGSGGAAAEGGRAEGRGRVGRSPRRSGRRGRSRR